MAELPELRRFLERVLEREALTEHEASETLRALTDPALPPALAGALGRGGKGLGTGVGEFLDTVDTVRIWLFPGYGDTYLPCRVR